jgi:hypothetical protein
MGLGSAEGGGLVNLNEAEEGKSAEPTEKANWSGWASFFSSRTLMVKTLGYGGRRIKDVKRDDGMEVMDIDDDENERRDVGEALY